MTGKFIAVIYYIEGDKQSDSFEGKWAEIAIWLAGQDGDNIDAVEIGCNVATD